MKQGLIHGMEKIRVANESYARKMKIITIITHSNVNTATKSDALYKTIILTVHLCMLVVQNTDCPKHRLSEVNALEIY